VSDIQQAVELRRQGYRYADARRALGVSESCDLRWVRRALAGLAGRDL